MKYCLFFFLILFSGFKLSAQNPCSVSQIPDSLKENAWAVIRQSATSFDRISRNKYSMNVHKVITILNPKGDRFAILAVHYDDDSEISSLKGYIYDANGKEINSIKKKDFSDEAINNSYTLLSDNRVKHYEPSENQYPYTVEYDYTVNYKSIIKFTNWIPCEDFHISVQEAKLKVSSPDELEIRHKMLNYPFNFAEQSKDDKTILNWTAGNLKATTYDYGRQSYLEIFPVVMVMPTLFTYDGCDGDFSSWKSYGEWVYHLLEGRDELSESTMTEIDKLIAGVSSEKEKVRLLYEYLQQKTRYVNISYGIGGFQPMRATEVDEKGYGDCKALTNYMRSLLKQASIAAYYSEIGNGRDQNILFPEFPTATQTNHAILCVPLEQDTVWLECTSQHLPMGYIGTDNSDRYALLITEHGGKLAKTPAYKDDRNRRESTIEIKLTETGISEVNLTSDFNNGKFEDIFSLVHLSKDDQKKALLRGLDADGLELGDYSLSDLSDTMAVARLRLAGKLAGICAKAGSRLLVKPNFLFPNEFPKSLSKKRTTALQEPVGYEYHDSLVVQIPDSYSIEFIPEDSSLETNYGTCSYSYQKSDSEVFIERKIRINKGTYKPEDFAEINLLLGFCSKMDQTQFILKKL